jgi:hypothetical protein
MENLSDTARASFKKMSDARLAVKLQQVGFTVEEIENMNRQAMLEAWAEIVVQGKDKPLGAPTGFSSVELERERLMFEKMKFETEQEEKRRRMEIEQRRFETEQEEKRRRFEMEQEEKKQMEDIRMQELELKRRELALQEQRDRREAARKNTVASKVKSFGDAFRNAAYKMNNDPVDLLPFFENVEQLFESLEIPPEIQVQLLRPYLSDKAKSLMLRLDVARTSDYAAVKQFLLHEFQLTPVMYLEKFNTLTRQNDETYVLLLFAIEEFD